MDTTKAYTLVAIMRDFEIKSYEFNSVVMAEKTYNKIVGSVASCYIRNNMTKEIIKH